MAIHPKDSIKVWTKVVDPLIDIAMARAAYIATLVSKMVSLKFDTALLQFPDLGCIINPSDRGFIYKSFHDSISIDLNTSCSELVI